MADGFCRMRILFTRQAGAYKIIDPLELESDDDR